MCCQKIIDVDNEWKKRNYTVLGEPCLRYRALRFEIANLYKKFFVSGENVDDVYPSPRRLN